MTGVIFRDTLRRTWWPMLYWGGGLGLMAFIAAWLVPLFDAIQLTEVVKNLPPVILAAAGLDENLTALATPEGIITVAFFSKFVLLFAAYPVVMGMRVTANEEEEGILDVLLSLPVARWRVVLEKFGAYALTLLVIGLIVYAGLWAGVQLTGIVLDMTVIGDALVNLIPMLLLVLAFTVCVGALLGRRSIALGIVTGFVLGSYALSTIAAMVTGGVSALFRAISFFSYFDVNGIVQSGLNWGHVWGLLLVSLLLMGAAVWSFQRRDVGV
ncbi:MAG: ABC transporter permease [Anaerolineae bacterium]|nr:ABC transporter permease [Anaerolineae bacterium]